MTNSSLENSAFPFLTVVKNFNVPNKHQEVIQLKIKDVISAPKPTPAIPKYGPCIGPNGFYG